jgi:hypothetical protein
MKSDDLIKRTMELYGLLPKYPALKRICYGDNKSLSIVAKTVPAMQAIDIIGMRQAVLSGQKGLVVRLRHPLTYHELQDSSHGTWMTTHPMELSQMIPALKRARGDVLVGGLGLGVIAHLMAQKPKIRSVTVVERDPNIIRLIKPYIHPKVQLVEADLFEFAKNLKANTYQYAFLDIWQKCGEWEWIKTIVPLRRILHDKIIRTDCWQESEMLDQVRMGLFRATVVDAEVYRNHGSRHYYAFRKVMEPWFPAQFGVADKQSSELLTRLVQVEQQNQSNAQIRRWAKIFLDEVGSDVWEHSFGRHWDSIPIPTD